jgi:hypothetical protein
MVSFKIFYWSSFYSLINIKKIVLYLSLDSRVHLVKYKNIFAIAISMSYIFERLWSVMVGGDFY